jgi:hypothetical protein
MVNSSGGSVFGGKAPLRNDSSSETGDSVSRQQAPLIAVLTDWAYAPDFASAVAASLQHPGVHNLSGRHEKPSANEPFDFWSAIAPDMMLDLSSGEENFNAMKG